MEPSTSSNVGTDISTMTPGMPVPDESDENPSPPPVPSEKSPEPTLPDHDESLNNLDRADSESEEIKNPLWIALAVRCPFITGMTAPVSLLIR